MDLFGLYFVLFIVCVLIGTVFLIRFGLKQQDNFQKENLQLTPDQIWKTVALRALKAGFPRADLLYGIYQNSDLTSVTMLVKDAQGTVISRVEKTMGERQARIYVGETLFLVEYPLSYWRRTIELHSSDGQSVLAKCTEMNFPIGKLRYEIENQGPLISERNFWSLLYQDSFRREGHVIGTVQSISQRIVGRVGLLPPSIPLPVRIFILAHPLF
jgi:hypothetical protein